MLDRLRTGAPRRIEAAARWLNAPWCRRGGERLARVFLDRPEWVSSCALQWAWRRFFDQPGACCPAGSAMRRFTDELGPGSRAVELLWARLRAEPRGPAARRLERLTRSVILGWLRRSLLARCRSVLGAPAAVLVEVQLAPYPDCDLHCRGCYSEGERTPPGRAPEPDRAHLRHLLDEAAACGALAVHVAGKGEPLLTPERAGLLLELIAERPHLIFTVATNGLHLTRELAARAAELGNLLLLVSVDGPQPLHDARRGAGAFQRVQRGLARLREAGALFGFSCMVSEPSFRALTAPEFVEEQRRAGCALGVYSRYFPLAAGGAEELTLRPASVGEYRTRLAGLRGQAAIPLLDLDELEASTGCRARAGLSVYVDGVSGQVAPCLRVPFAPEECRIDRASGVGLVEVLAHPFFARYRGSAAGGCDSCETDPAVEPERVLAALGGAAPPRLIEYRDRIHRLREACP